MPEYLHPGVYIEELRGPQPIQGVSTSTTGMVGVTRKGPSTGLPRLVTSFGEFRDLFGGFLHEPDIGDRVRWELDDREGGTWWLFPLAVKGFFDNGGHRLYVRRVVSSAAVASSASPDSGVVGTDPGGTEPPPLGAPPTPPPNPAPQPLLRISASSPGAWGDQVQIRLRPAKVRRIPAISGAGDGPITTSLAADLAQGGSSATIVWPARLTGATGPLALQIGTSRWVVTTPITQGTGANAGTATIALSTAAARRLPRGTGVKILRQVAGTLPAPAPAGLRRIPVARVSRDTVYPNALVLIGGVQATVTAVTEAVPPAQGSPGTPASVTVSGLPVNPAVFETDLITVVEASLTVRYQEQAPASAPPGSRPNPVEESFPALRLHPLSGQPGSIVDVLNADSRLVSAETVETLGVVRPPVTWANFPGWNGGDEWIRLQGGDDQPAALTPDDFVGQDIDGRRTGIQSLEDIEQISICAVPGMWSATVQGALLGLCERLHDRFAILDPQMGLTVQGVQAFRQRLDSEYAAIYHPWLKVRDPLRGADTTVPPSGHLAGLYARVDVERGVHKAPANESVLEINGLADDINEREQDILNPIGINALRQFPTRGLRVWGARTLTSVPEWTYVNVRRLFLYIESSIKTGTQWVVFEPNNEALWALVVQAVTNFLDTVWRTGALEGTRQSEAFYVKCDLSTMTPDDIANGRLVIEIGIAPTKPAEFVIFRFQQKTRDQVPAS